MEKNTDLITVSLGGFSVHFKTNITLVILAEQ